MTSAFTPIPAIACVPALGAPAFADSSPTRLGEASPVAIDFERSEDADAREALLDRAFGPTRFAKTCERLRAGRMPAAGLSLVARAEAGASLPSRAMVGTVRLWHVSAGGVPALMLGPLAVDAGWRCHRIGARLMEAAIVRARRLGHRAVVLVGDAPYYARFGFERHHATALRMPGPVEAERLLGLELVPGALVGAAGLVHATGAFDPPLRRGKGGGLPGRLAA